MFHVKLDAYWDTRTRTEGAAGVSRARHGGSLGPACIGEEPLVMMLQTAPRFEEPSPR